VAVNVETKSLALPHLGWLTGYGELLRTMVVREVRVRYKASALGILWSLLYPLAMMAVYVLVFSVLLKTAGDIPHYPLFVLAGLGVWGFFQAGVQLGTGSLLANADLIKKVWFPRELVVTAAVLAQTVSIGVILVVLVPLDLIIVPRTARTMVLAVPILAALLCLVLGFSWITATANVFFRDVEHLLGVLFLPWFFLTPVLYSLTLLPAAVEQPWLVHVLRYGNPVTPYVESLRAVILEGTVPGATLLLYVFLVGPVLGLVGLWVVQRYEDRLAIEL
jgi:homopolymeric O-antigen transport system permease protein